jgi:salicylate hydroxylase
MNKLQIGIVGGGIGGLSLGAALYRQGAKITILEQAPRFTRIGADINLTPNAVKALDGIGLGKMLRSAGARPTHRVSRTWDTGVETSRLAMSDAAESLYGAPQLTLHRADLLDALEAAVPADSMRFGSRVEALQSVRDGAVVSLADGVKMPFDVIVGADGIHSVVRTSMFGQEHPRFTGVVAYRAVIPRERLDLPNLDQFTKWWGPNPQSQIVVFPISAGREIFIFATTAQDEWRHESWTMPGDVDELRSVYAAFHPDARRLLDECDSVFKTALYERDPLSAWSKGVVTLIGDACHPMMPFMAQGAGMAIEDSIVLSRCLTDLAPTIGPQGALQRYESLRLERTSQIQIKSRGNEWLRDGGNADWVYGYDVWTIPLEVGEPSKPVA